MRLEVIGELRSNDPNGVRPAVDPDQQHTRFWTQRDVLTQEHVDAGAGRVRQVVEDVPHA
jgi:hypothetical protein